ncbi:MAG: hypothetical protein ACE5KM_18860 [Planctomycetaceae bacterium]
MANLKKYDPRLESLVMEAKTLWDPEIGDISDDDKAWLSQAIHAAPQYAANIEYDRSHTGFTRIITVTVADIERLYQQNVND